MTELKAGDDFPEGVTFMYVPYLPENDAVTACGIPVKYNASAGEPSFCPHISAAMPC